MREIKASWFVNAGSVAYILYKREEDKSDDEDDFFSKSRPRKKYVEQTLWWSGEEEDGYDQWAEYADDDRDNFEPFPPVQKDSPTELVD